VSVPAEPLPAEPLPAELLPLVAPSATEDRLLEVAERLVAERGVDAVSVRSVTAEAGANVAAIHYHFGSKAALVRAVLERRIPEATARRDVLLRALEAAPHPPSLRAVAEAFVRPLADMADAEPTHHYPAFLAAIFRAGPDYRDLGNGPFQPQFERFDALLAAALPTLGLGVRRLRFALFVEAAIHALAAVDERRRAFAAAGEPVTDAALVEHVIDALAGLLAGPGPDASEVSRVPSDR
jgi:AcrR family transcriptional regulator